MLLLLNDSVGVKKMYACILYIGSCECFQFPLNYGDVESKAALVGLKGCRSVVPELQLYCVTSLRIVFGYE